MTNTQLQKHIQMYFQPSVVEEFSRLEQNNKNYAVARIIDSLIVNEIKDMTAPLRAAELGGGAHPDRYDSFFATLLTEPLGHIDWVDISGLMLEQAKKYLQETNLENRLQVISFIEAEITEYLDTVADESLDLGIMKYTFDHIENIDELFSKLTTKLKPNGKLIATINNLSPQLQSASTNARFLYNNQEFPLDETREMHDGDTFTVKFYKESGNPSAGYLESAETTKYYHSAEKITALAEQHGFEVFLGDWKERIETHTKQLKLDVLVLRKK